MAARLIAPDISSYQKALTSAYKRDFLIFRVQDGWTYQDPHFLANANECAALYKKGTLKGAMCYIVYRPGNVNATYNFFVKLMGPKPPVWLKGVMIDVESWGGQIKGDHSTEINRLAGKLAAYMGTWNAVIAYGNWNDLPAIYPHRDKRIRFIEAKYSSSIPNRTGKIGQQYTDGQTRWPVPKGLPRSTAPFGACDHNVFPNYANGAALVRALAKSTPKPAAKPTSKKPFYPFGGSGGHLNAHGLVDSSGHYALYVAPDGTVRMHKDGKAHKVALK